MKLLLCTQNENKIKEIKEALKDFPLKLVSLKDLKDFEDIEETGQTFKENALLKAKYYAKKHNLKALADDTGLEVVSLNMRPGVYSSRYAKDDKAKISKMLLELNEITNRDAQFRTIIALYNPLNEKEVYFEGILKGTITYEPKGTEGFGYDPIFYLPELNKTLAQISLNEKSNISHRGIALKKLKEYIYENIDNF